MQIQVYFRHVMCTALIQSLPAYGVMCGNTKSVQGEQASLMPIRQMVLAIVVLTVRMRSTR